MTVVLTTAGVTHIGNLPSGPFFNAFDALVIGVGADVPAVTDTQAQANQTSVAPVPMLLQVESGYPVLGDTDPRNTGAATDRYTWKFRAPAGNPFVAANMALTNWNGGVLDPLQPVGVHGKQTVSCRSDEALEIWVNAKTGATPTIVTAATNEMVSRPMRALTWTARTKGLRSVPHGQAVGESRLSAQAPMGSPVWTAAVLADSDGSELAPGAVERIELRQRRWDGSDRAWKEVVYPLDVSEAIPSTPIEGDPRWPSGRFNFSHNWIAPAGYQDPTWELEYRVYLSDGSRRTITVEVRFT